MTILKKRNEFDVMVTQIEQEIEHHKRCIISDTEDKITFEESIKKHLKKLARYEEKLSDLMYYEVKDE